MGYSPPQKPRSRSGSHTWLRNCRNVSGFGGRSVTAFHTSSRRSISCGLRALHSARRKRFASFSSNACVGQLCHPPCSRSLSATCDVSASALSTTPAGFTTPADQNAAWWNGFGAHALPHAFAPAPTCQYDAGQCAVDGTL